MTSDGCSRLMACEVCGGEQYKYTCPKCGVKTCRLACVNIHKRELECDGLRNLVDFKLIPQFTDLDLHNDVRLLEETTRFLYGAQKNPMKRFTAFDRVRDVPAPRLRLKAAARKRGTVLFFLLDHFSRRKINTSRLNFKENKIYWRVEWTFVNAHPSPAKFHDKQCAEDVRLSRLLEKYFDPTDPELDAGALMYYRSAGLNNCRILLKSERLKGCAKKYHELDARLSLKENLAGKCIVEFPTIVVIFKDHSYGLNVVDSDEEAESSESHHENSSEQTPNDGPESSSNREKSRESFTAAFARQQKLQIENEIKAAQKKNPKNFLFSAEYSSDEEL